MPAAPKDKQISMRLPHELKDRMETYAEMTGRTTSYVALEAMGEYLDWRMPQIEDLKAAVEAADAGDFASEEEIDAVFATYAKNPTARRRGR